MPFKGGRRWRLSSTVKWPFTGVLPTPVIPSDSALCGNHKLPKNGCVFPSAKMCWALSKRIHSQLYLRIPTRPLGDGQGYGYTHLEMGKLRLKKSKSIWQSHNWKPDFWFPQLRPLPFSCHNRRPSTFEDLRQENGYLQTTKESKTCSHLQFCWRTKFECSTCSKAYVLGTRWSER